MKWGPDCVSTPRHGQSSLKQNGAILHVSITFTYGAAAIAQWIRLFLPSCGRPGVRIPSTTSMLFRFIFELWCEKNENKYKKGWDWAIFKKTFYFRIARSFNSVKNIFLSFSSRRQCQMDKNLKAYPPELLRCTGSCKQWWLARQGPIHRRLAR